MTHSSEIVAYKKLSNGQFSFCVRCCDNPSTDSWHTVSGDIMATPKKRKESISGAMMKVAKEHEAAIKAEEAAVEVMGQKGEMEI